MKNNLLLTLIFLLVAGLLAKSSQAGLLDQVIQQAVQPQQQQQQPQRGQSDATQQPQQGSGGLIDGLGGVLGVDPKKLNILKKGMQTVQAMQPIDEEAELVLGETISMEAFSRYGGLYKNDSLTLYINLVGKTVAEVSDRPELAYHFAILDSHEENAFAAPGGFVFVTIGLLRALQNEAELAGILGHELAHINRKHMLDTLQRSSVLSNVSELSMAAMNKDPQMLGAAIDQVSDMLFTHGIDKELEYEADLFGLEYAYRAGYAPQGLQDYLQRLARKQNSTQSVFFTTHPPVGERLQRVKQKLTKLPKDNRLATLEDRWKRNTKSM